MSASPRSLRPLDSLPSWVLLGEDWQLERPVQVLQVLHAWLLFLMLVPVLVPMPALYAWWLSSELVLVPVPAWSAWSRTLKA